MDRVPAGPAVHQGQIEAISEEWVSDKSLPEMGFTLGGINELDDDNVRCLIAIDGDRTIHGVTSWMPSYRHGAVVGWTLDFMRRRSSKGEVSTVFQGAADAGSMWWLPVLLFLLTVVPAGICAAKGKLVTAALGIVYQPIGLIGAVRLAKPGSWWDRRVYGPTSRRRSRAERRFGANYHGRWERLRDLVGGAPSDQVPGSDGAETGAGEETTPRATIHRWSKSITPAAISKSAS